MGRRALRAFGVAVFCVFGVVACSSSSSSPESGNPEVVQQCNDFAAVICGDEADCEIQAELATESERDTVIANCMADWGASLDCSHKAKVVGAPLVCYTDVAKVECSAFQSNLGQLPPSCVDVFQ